MINLKVLPSSDVIMMCELGKLIKASIYAYYIFDEDTIIVYGSQDFMFSTISRIIVPNATDIRGTMVLETSVFNIFCKTLVPFTDVEVRKSYLVNSITGAMESVICKGKEALFIEKKGRLNDMLEDSSIFQFSIDEATKISLRDTLSKMRATTSQKMFKIANGYLITIYSGCIPVNKADILNIDVLSGDTWFLCKYEILKKKVPAPIHVFALYRRL